MKRAASLLLAVIMLFCLSSCGNEYSKLTDDEIAAKVDSGELGTLYAHYSVQNGDSGDFYVQFDSDCGGRFIFQKKDFKTVFERKCFYVALRK